MGRGRQAAHAERPLSAEGKSLKDEDVLQKLPVGTTATLYFRDLGAQISWVTVSPPPPPPPPPSSAALG